MQIRRSASGRLLTTTLPTASATASVVAHATRNQSRGRRADQRTARWPVARTRISHALAEHRVSSISTRTERANGNARVWTRAREVQRGDCGTHEGTERDSTSTNGPASSVALLPRSTVVPNMPGAIASARCSAMVSTSSRVDTDVQLTRDGVVAVGRVGVSRVHVSTGTPSALRLRESQGHIARRVRRGDGWASTPR